MVIGNTPPDERNSAVPQSTGVSLLKQIGLVSATSFVVGTMIGKSVDSLIDIRFTNLDLT